MKADLKEQLQFPQEIAQTTLRPDIVIWSRNPKRVVLVELTVPWEERIEESHELKRSKYEDLAQSCKSNGWNTQVFPIEVGCRGFPSQSVWRMLGALGIKGAARKRTVHALGRTAERASSWLWMLRSTHEWQPRNPPLQIGSPTKDRKKNQASCSLVGGHRESSGKDQDDPRKPHRGN
ncbi:uncharacterized protein LOC132719607 [Ruditapes philippinarum]|uniref:uncharacterized protein LOC132719607 n=1 Tax=Ruditapes philippinarum TaxID=129788 RepID=UPI00295B5F2A|nr:uncharacterized protein LOC132719607 [Ruditapes philippinarum]